MIKTSLACSEMTDIQLRFVWCICESFSFIGLLTHARLPGPPTLEPCIATKAGLSDVRKNRRRTETPLSVRFAAVQARPNFGISTYEGERRNSGDEFSATYPGPLLRLVFWQIKHMCLLCLLHIFLTFAVDVIQQV